MIPILEQITQNIVTTLQNIAPPSYESTLKVYRFTRKGMSPQDSLAVVVQGDPTKDEVRTGGPLVYWDQPYSIICYVMESEDSSIVIETRLNTIRADVEKALRSDETRGGFAFDTVIDAPEYDSAGQVPCVVVNATVRYRTQYDNPYAQ